MGEAGGLQELEAAGYCQGAALQIGADGFVPAVELHQQGGGALGHGLDVGGSAGLVLHGAQGGAVQQFQGGGTRVPQRDDGGTGSVEIGEEQKGCDLHGQIRHRLQHCFGDEGQGALGAHQQVAEDLHGLVEVHEGVEGVARGVLGLVFGANALGQRRVGQQIGLQLQEAFGQGWFRLAELLIGVWGARIDDGARREQEGQGFQGVVGILGHAAAHAAGVVGEDAAHGAGIDGGRIRAHLGLEEFEGVVHMDTQDTGLDLDLGAAL